MTSSGVTWHRVACVDDVTEDQPLGTRIGETHVAVFKVGDRYYATSNVCTHEFTLLHEGFVDGDVIECPLHQARFHIPTGNVLAPPAEAPLSTYPVRIQGEDILVALSRE